jgi:hypothetical protein
MDAGFGCRDVGNVARVSARIGLRDIGYIDPEVGFGLRVTGIDQDFRVSTDELAGFFAVLRPGIHLHPLDPPWDTLQPLHIGKSESEFMFYPLHDPLQAATDPLRRRNIGHCHRVEESVRKV